MNMSSHSMDWRHTLKINTQKTYFVMGLFLLIYCALGFLIDIYLYTNHFPQATISQLILALFTLQLFPKVTAIMLIVAALSIVITLLFQDQLMLLGTEYREIRPETAQNLTEKQLYNIIEEIKIAASLRYMPKVYLIEADYMNAFASGYSEKSAMVAITRGLMSKLTRAELTAVMAHEVSHIRHMDIKLTLVASVLSNLILMVLDILFYNLIFSSNKDGENRNRQGLVMVIILLRYLLPVINILLLLYLSRTREYMADAGAVELTRDNHPLASALMKINTDHQTYQAAYSQAYQRTPHENVRREAYIFDPTQAGIKAVNSLSDAFSTHPSLKDRLAALGFKYES